MEELAAMMTKLVGSLETRMETRMSSIESRLLPPPTPSPTASMPYGMPGYGSTSLGNLSLTAAATMATAAFTSFTTPSPVSGSTADVRLPKIQAALQEMIQLE
jgi:hypothetical protein